MKVFGNGAHRVALVIRAAAQAVVMNALEDGQPVRVRQRPQHLRQRVMTRRGLHFDGFRNNEGRQASQRGSGRTPAVKAQNAGVAGLRWILSGLEKFVRETVATFFGG